MPVKFKQKTRKWRGRTSHGWGMKKKHRGGGSQGGRGLGGSHKHKFSYVTSKEPDRYGYKGFYSKKKRPKAINIDELAKLDGNAFDLKKLGYGKLLGKGTITRAVTVTVTEVSKQAKEKIEKAGGNVQLNAKKVHPVTKSFKKSVQKVAKPAKEPEANESE
ncbi:MAG: large subunit ribosomal protein L15 [archaeon GW2011_AR5]|nr:50S ribosomal protein L15, large subunit ribosomal protein L15 [uncultured archaeon]KHO48321.1 MAG: large subunit ribosomal protein L15 [archaeon GW2011_AR5]